jgi:hypothetical protein
MGAFFCGKFLEKKHLTKAKLFQNGISKSNYEYCIME